MTNLQMEAVPEIEESGLTIIENGPEGWPVLDQKALYGIVGDFVALATENSEADPAAVLATFLTRFAVECGTGPYFMVGDSMHYARLFTVIVGASSKARKGTSAKPVECLFDFNFMNEMRDESDRIITAKHSPGPLSTGEGLIYAVRDPQEEWRQDRKTGNGEMVLADPGVEDKRLFVLDEEFAAALNCIKREGNTLSSILRGAWDNGNIEPLTKTSRIKTSGAHIGICTHITMEELHKRLSGVELSNGFANRFIWCFARRTKLVPFPTPMPEPRLFLLRERLIESLRYTREIHRVRWSEESKALWEKTYRELSKDRFGLVGKVLDRSEAQVTRLAMIYALLDGKAIIEPWHLEAACAFWEYCSQSAEFIFKDRESDAISGKIIVALKGGPKSTTDLYRTFKNKISRSQMENTLNSLAREGRIACGKEKTGGAPKTIYSHVY